MRKVLVACAVVTVLTGILGADIRRESTVSAQEEKKKPCYGYTIIEFGKGINCNGDTVKLVKVNGGQQLAQFAN